jgi:hypothetical protein
LKARDRGLGQPPHAIGRLRIFIQKRGPVKTRQLWWEDDNIIFKQGTDKYEYRIKIKNGDQGRRFFKMAMLFARKKSDCGV